MVFLRIVQAFILIAAPAFATGPEPSATVPALVPSGAGATPGGPAEECRSVLGAEWWGGEETRAFCQGALRLPECKSVEGRPIPHFARDGVPSALERARAEKAGGTMSAPLRILVFGLVHGDEPLSGRLTLEWIRRLSSIEPRNSWRIVPILNPDGHVRKTRMNARGVDLNRNFPTRDWDAEAAAFWQKAGKGDKRRFPGEAAGSEPETQCARRHIKDFRPDFIVAVHTPYGLLDFDGPKVRFPSYGPLPWRSLGNFPGSLGRYMWRDHQVPVLTIEMRDQQMVDPARIQDVVGHLAIETLKTLGPRPNREELFGAL